METYVITRLHLSGRPVNTLPEFLIQSDGKIICTVFTDSIGNPKTAIGYGSDSGRTYVEVEEGDRMIHFREHKPFLRKRYTEISIFYLQLISRNHFACFHREVSERFEGEIWPIDMQFYEYQNAITTANRQFIHVMAGGECARPIYATVVKRKEQPELQSQPLCDAPAVQTRWESIEL